MKPAMIGTRGRWEALRSVWSGLARGFHAAIVLLCAGCGVSDRREGAGPVRTDSAGVEIVWNTDEPLLRGELQPARKTFGSEEEGPELFGQVADARLHPSGSLWIAERQTQEIRVFDSGSGAHRFTIGGEGDGPGEFRQSRLLGFDAEGAAYVYDDRHRRLSVFSESGELLGSHPMPSSLGMWPQPLHVTRTGTLLGSIPRTLGYMPANGATIRDTVRTWIMRLDGTAPTLVAETLGPLWYFQNNRQYVVPYTDGPLRGFWDDRVYVTDDAGEVSYSVYGPSGLERRADIERATRRIDDSSAKMFVERLRRSRAPESRVRFYEKHLPDMPIPEAGRAWDALVVTDQGGAWLLRAVGAKGKAVGAPPADQVWDVFDAKGEFVGHIQLPAKSRLVQVSEQSALMIVADAMGRVTVAIHRVRWIDKPHSVGLDGTFPETRPHSPPRDVTEPIRFDDVYSRNATPLGGV